MDIVSEKALKNAILENIEDFMKELGEGYSFIKSEYKISDYGINNYIDNNVKQISQKTTIGIIITKKDNKFVMNYCNNEYIYQSIYQTN